MALNIYYATPFVVALAFTLAGVQLNDWRLSGVGLIFMVVATAISLNRRGGRARD